MVYAGQSKRLLRYDCLISTVRIGAIQESTGMNVSASRLAPPLSAEEFMAWASEQESGRFELHAGEIVAMASERVNHNFAKSDIDSALKDAIAATGLPCEVFADGMAVRIDDATVYEPDAQVRCGGKSDGESVWSADPVVVVEVVSPASATIDAGAKLAGYFALASVRHYLIIDTRQRLVIHHTREHPAMVLRAGAIVLDPPGISIAVEAIFARF